MDDPSRFHRVWVCVAYGVLDNMDAALDCCGPGKPDAEARLGGCAWETEVDDDLVEEDNDGVEFHHLGMHVERPGGDYNYERGDRHWADGSFPRAVLSARFISGTLALLSLPFCFADDRLSYKIFIKDTDNPGSLNY